MEEVDENPGSVYFSAGVQYYHVNYGFGISVVNPYAINIGNSDFKYDEEFQIRLGAHKLFEQVLLASCQLSWGDDKLDSHWGLQYCLAKKLFLRTGIETKKSEWSFGLGYLIGKVQTDVAFVYHEYLGFSPSVSIQFIGR